MQESCIDLLNQFNISLAVADPGKRFPYFEIITANFVYLRFHGHESLYASDYNETELRNYAEKIINWRSEGKSIWAFFNNDFYGYAVKNAIRLIELTTN